MPAVKSKGSFILSAILAFSLVLGTQINSFANRTSNFKLVNAASMASTITSGTVNIDQMSGYAVQAVWTGSPVGTIEVDASNDGSNWSAIAGSTQVVNGAGSFLWNISEAYYAKVRVLYTATSGTGSLTVTVEDKGP